MPNNVEPISRDKREFLRRFDELRKEVLGEPQDTNVTIVLKYRDESDEFEALFLGGDAFEWMGMLSHLQIALSSQYARSDE